MSNQLTKQQLVSNLLPRIKEIGVSETQFKKEVSFALQHVQKNKMLSKADGNSVMQSILNTVQVGLSLNPVLKLGYLVPRYDRQRNKSVAAFEPSYQGLVKLATDSGSVVSVSSHLVYENDHFEVSYGTNESVEHKPTFKDKGEVIAVYAVATLPDGSKMVDVMDLQEVHDIRERSDSYTAYTAKKIESCVWVSDFGEMARKTVIRRLFKYIPKTEKFEKVATAIRYDEDDYTATDKQKDYIEQLLLTSTLAEHRKEQVYLELEGYSQQQAQKCIEHLKDNQVDPLQRGNMSAKEISEAVQRKLDDPKA